MICFSRVTLRRGATVLLQDVSWTIFPKQHIGIIGANGTGKSSLFAMLLGQLEPDVGELQLSSQLVLAHVAQETPALAMSAHDFVLDGDKELRKVQAELTQAEEAQDGHKVAALHEKLYAVDGYTADARAAQLLDGLGFSAAQQQKPVSDFSGGWRMRLNLAQALMCRSDILLLDEPTNHLDLDAVIWLESWLRNYQGTLLLISHDRDFLDKTVDQIAFLHHQTLKTYSGNYSTFEELRANELMLQQAMYEKQQKKIAHLQSFINRFKAKATKAKQAQSRVKAIERMEKVAAVQAESPFQFEFQPPKQCPNPLLTLHQVDIGYDDHAVLKKLNLGLTPKDRIAVLGPNGAGKSTFIKLLAGQLQAIAGEVTIAQGLKVGYFAQHQVDALNMDGTPISHMQKLSPDMKEVELRTFLGGFDFVGDRVFQTVKTFSGGEKSRLALALIVWQRPNLLLLDEPTNHLDLEMRQALALALQSYEGAMILVSHDRYLLRSTTDQLYLIANGKLDEFKGDMSDYQQWLIDYRKEQKQPADKSLNEGSRKEQRQQAAQLREKMRPYVKRVEQLEKNIATLQKKIEKVETLLADEAMYSDDKKDELQKNIHLQGELNKQLAALEEEWLEASEELAKLSSHSE